MYSKETRWNIYKKLKCDKNAFSSGFREVNHSLCRILRDRTFWIILWREVRCSMTSRPIIQSVRKKQWNIKHGRDALFTRHGSPRTSTQPCGAQEASDRASPGVCWPEDHGRQWRHSATHLLDQDATKERCHVPIKQQLVDFKVLLPTKDWVAISQTELYFALQMADSMDVTRLALLLTFVKCEC